MKFSKTRILKIVSLTFGLYFSFTGMVQAQNIGIVSKDAVNVRIAPDKEILHNLDKDDFVTIIEKQEKWYKVATKEDKEGYIHEDLLKVAQIGIVKENDIHLRQEPTKDGKILGKVGEKTEISIIGEVDGWYKVLHEKEIKWISKEFVQIKEEKTIQYGEVNAKSGLNLRKAPVNGQVIQVLSYGTTFQIIETKNGWHKIKLENGVEGFISEDFATLLDGAPTKKVKTSRDAVADRDIIEYAKKFLGTKYVWGGASPSGFDCSGFTTYIMKQYGVSLNRIAADQARNGSSVGRKDLERGDLVFFNTSGSGISHVGIYIENGQFIHSSSARGGVIISSMGEGYYNSRFVTARRVLK